MHETWLLGAAFLLILSVLASKVTSRFGIPSLLLFLGIGMLVGSDGIGNITFDNAELAQRVGSLALSFILFSGGMDTSWSRTRRILGRGTLLATVGVLVSATLVAGFAVIFLHFTWLEGLLLGATISSTDAAAVFSLLRARNIHLPQNVKALVEFESGSNDPMAFFLTVGLLPLLTQANLSPASLLPLFARQMIVGACMGWIGGRLLQFLINRLNLESEGLYLVLTAAWVLLVSQSTHWLGGNEFLAVYLSGMVLGNSNFLRKKTLVLFHDGLAWLMQIVMFLLLGLLVYPHKFKGIALPGVALAVFLLLVARPASVFLVLWRSSFHWKERLLISWAGLRGAVPIVLATYPWTQHIVKSELIFHLVFVVVLLSVLVQGTTLSWLARKLGLNQVDTVPQRYGSRHQIDNDVRKALLAMAIHPGSPLEGKTMLELSNWFDVLVVSIHRGRDVIVPRGSTQMHAEDVLYVLGEPAVTQALEQATHPIPT